MQEILQLLLSYLRGMWHRRWIGLAAAWLAAIVGIAVVYRIPEKYEASARVYVDTESLLSPLLAGLAIQPNMDQRVALISRTLISRPNVEKRNGFLLPPTISAATLPATHLPSRIAC